MNGEWKNWIRACILTGMCCLLLSGCGDKVEPPEAYVIGENSTIPLDSCLDEEEGGKLTAIEAPESEEEEDDGKEEEAEELSEKTGGEDEAPAEETYTYTYEEVPAAALDRYAAALTADEEGFCVIDEDCMPLTDLPDFSEAEGSVVFARQAVEEGSLFEIAIDWTEEACVVVVSCPEGGFYEEEAEEAPEEEEIMTLLQTVDYMRSMKPSDLGLEGDSMDAYSVVPIQGTPLVDGEVCRHINIYRLDETSQTNTFTGSYLVGVGKIYRLDPIEGTVERVL